MIHTQELRVIQPRGLGGGDHPGHVGLRGFPIPVRASVDERASVDVWGSVKLSGAALSLVSLPNPPMAPLSILRVSAHFVESRDRPKPTTTFLIKLDPSVMQREAIIKQQR